ncbi:MAG TPA: 30S ribosomal protein S9 [Opitutales bacterium]|jgi:small subunit ribosomal protein S9|nr:30S ribosomal protein S9 [Opitutales bacterium]
MISKTDNIFVGTGRRKTATARVRLFPGTGKITVNGRDLTTHLKVERFAKMASAPLTTASVAGSYDVIAEVSGGGNVGQAGAISLGVARALQRMNPELRSPLKKAGHLTRDGREKERKKSGQPGARRRFQFSKR